MTPDRWPLEDEATLRRLWKAGFSYSEIEREFAGKHSEPAISGKIVRLGLQRPSRRASPEARQRWEHRMAERRLARLQLIWEASPASVRERFLASVTAEAV